MESLEAVYESEELFPLFANRLLSDSRPEYVAYLRWSGFEPGATPDPIVVLGVTEGIRQTDAVEVFPCPVPDGDGCYFNKFFLHGVRWMAPAVVERINELTEGELLKLMLDFQNEHDPQAVAVQSEIVAHADWLRAAYTWQHDVGQPCATVRGRLHRAVRGPGEFGTRRCRIRRVVPDARLLAGWLPAVQRR